MKILSSIGIGNASVDTILPDSRVTAGETIDATVEVEGGSSAQEVEAIYFALLTTYRSGSGTEQVAIDEFELSDGFTVEAGDEQEHDVDIEVPPHTPVTMDAGEVWIETGLDIDWAVDPDDKDELDVEPDPRLRAVLDAMGSVGFDMQEAVPVATGDTDVDTDRTFVQQFGYRPVAEPYTAEFDAVDVYADPEADALPITLVVDINEDQDEEVDDYDRRATMTVETDDAESIATDLEDQFEKFF